MLKNVKFIITISFILSTLFAQDWGQVGTDIDGEAAGDNSGLTVSLSSDGTRIAIGTYLNDGTGTDAGHVRVYSEFGGVWAQVGSDIDGEAANDNSGISVALSSDGTRAAIGARYNDGTGTDAGHVRVYSESGGVWTQVGSDIDGETAGDQLGFSVSLSSDGKRLAVGAPLNDSSGKIDAGHVRVYSESGGTWTQIGSDIDGESAYDYSGYSVALSPDGTRVAIGARENDGGGGNAGHARVYSESGGVWTQVGSDIDGEAAGDQSGYSVSLSSDGTRVAIGAPENDGVGNNAGHVRVYSESGGVWTQVGSDIDGEAAGDQSGWSVSLSSGGTRVAIGAYLNDGTGADAGHARVYSESGGVWTQIGSDIDGEVANDYSGHSVSLSSNGKRVAIGAPQNDGTGSDAGHARVFFEDATLPVELTSFIVKNTLEGVLCTWNTESEFENLGFILERRIKGDLSTQASSWHEIASYKIDEALMGKGTTSLPTDYEYVDKLVNVNTSYEYRLADVAYDGIVTYHATRTITVEQKPLSSTIESFTVLPAYPNPFNPTTTITYGLDNNSKVEIQIYDISGKLITTLLKTEQTQGWHSIEWNGTDANYNQVPAGIYLSRITSDNTTKTIKLMLLK